MAKRKPVGLACSCERAQLNAALRRVSRAVSTSSPLPILHNVLIEADGETMRLAANDLELAMECRLSATVTTPGAACLPGRLLGEIVAGIAGDHVTFALGEQNGVEVVGGSSRYRVMGLPSEEFPAAPEVGGAVSFTLPADALHRALKIVRTAVSDDETRPTITAVKFEVGPGKLRLVATDTHRLAMCDLLCEGVDEESAALVPDRVAAELFRLSADQGQREIQARWDQNQALFRIGETTLVSRLIAGQFPRYERIIPKELPTTWILSLAGFGGAVDRVMVVARENSNRVHLAVEEGRLVLRAVSGVIGEAREEIEVEVAGNAIGGEIILNGRFLRETLAALDGERARLDLSDPGAATTLRVEGRDDARVVIMPMSASA